MLKASYKVKLQSLKAAHAHRLEEERFREVRFAPCPRSTELESCTFVLSLESMSYSRPPSTASNGHHVL